MTTSTVYTQVNRVSAAICAQALQTSVSDLHEAMGGTLAKAHTMSHLMRPLITGVRIAGPAVTAHCPPADNLMELLLMVDAAHRASAGTVSVVTPYFGYARQDRKDKPRVPIAAKLVANLISFAKADRIMAWDFHAGQIQGFFDIPVDHLDSHAVFIPYIENLRLENLTFAAPDVGATNRIREIASYFEAEMVICDKHRKRANEIASMVVIGEVADRDIVLIDDICDTAGTLSKAAKLLKDKGARSVRALCTHPVLSGNAYVNIENSVMEELVVCDTIPLRGQSSKLKVLSVANLFASAIKNAYENQSITSLFIHSQLRNK